MYMIDILSSYLLCLVAANKHYVCTLVAAATAADTNRYVAVSKQPMNTTMQTLTKHVAHDRSLMPPF